MRLTITHTSDYAYDAPLYYALQRLRLTPQDSRGQKILSWETALDGASHEVSFEDHHGNLCDLVSCQGDRDSLRITARGVVETQDHAGVVGPHSGAVPLWLYLRPTPLTATGTGIRQLAKKAPKLPELERLHALMDLIRADVAYKPGRTDTATTAEEALAHGEGVCQDHSHVFIATARQLSIPARYVSGYLLMDDRSDQVASHAWAEAHVEGLGWIGFDVANGISPDERYVRIATGLDYLEAAPISGIRTGPSQESLAVSIRVEQ